MYSQLLLGVHFLSTISEVRILKRKQEKKKKTRSRPRKRTRKKRKFFLGRFLRRGVLSFFFFSWPYRFLFLDRFLGREFACFLFFLIAFLVLSVFFCSLTFLFSFYKFLTLYVLHVIRTLTKKAGMNYRLERWRIW